MSQDGILQYLEFTSSILGERQTNSDWKYSSYEQFVLREGKPFEPCSGEIGEKGLCFENTLRYLMETDDPDLAYCEGYAHTAKLALPIQHAWVGHSDGSAYDVTWDDGAAYYGISFNVDWAIATTIRNGYYGIIGNDWSNGNELLKEGIPIEALCSRSSVSP